jgi:hypothetical protein
MGKHDDGLAGHDNGTEAGGACGGMRFAFPPYGGIGRVLPVGPAGHESGAIAAVEGEIADQFVPCPGPIWPGTMPRSSQISRRTATIGRRRAAITRVSRRH